jgi:hypothetical protein
VAPGTSPDNPLQSVLDLQNRTKGSPATFQSLAGASFVVNGAAQASDSVLTTASIERKWINNGSIAATFEGEFSNVTSSYLPFPIQALSRSLFRCH